METVQCINQAAFDMLSPKLRKGETILWCGQPNTRRPVGMLLLQYGVSLLFSFTYLAYFMYASIQYQFPAIVYVFYLFMAMVTLMIITGVIRELIGRRHVYYAVTNRRLLALEKGTKGKEKGLYTVDLRCLTQESYKGHKNGVGTVIFGKSAVECRQKSEKHRSSRMIATNGRLTFFDIDNWTDVYGIYQTAQANCLKELGPPPAAPKASQRAAGDTDKAEDTGETIE